MVMKPLQTATHLIYSRERGRRSSKHTSFSYDVCEGVTATFGEPASKQLSKNYHLTSLSFLKRSYTVHDAECFWSSFQIVHARANQLGRKFPSIFRVLGRSDRLIRDGYILICDRQDVDRTSLSLNASYEGWLNRFSINDTFLKHSDLPQEAIISLINRVNFNRSVLRDLPTKAGWRAFEQLVAELFSQFGYQVVLTARSNDGGRDVIAIANKDNPNQHKILIECKHQIDSVEVSVVDRLIGVAVCEDETPNAIIVATTSKFTEGAIRRQINQRSLSSPITLEKKDFDGIINWIGDYHAIGFRAQDIKQYLAEAL